MFFGDAAPADASGDNKRAIDDFDDWALSSGFQERIDSAGQRAPGEKFFLQIMTMALSEGADRTSQ
jgi:hypothetical protein